MPHASAIFSLFPAHDARSFVRFIGKKALYTPTQPSLTHTYISSYGQKFPV